VVGKVSKRSFSLPRFSTKIAPKTQDFFGCITLCGGTYPNCATGCSHNNATNAHVGNVDRRYYHGCGVVLDISVRASDPVSLK
jgi:hypothetical protein